MISEKFNRPDIQERWQKRMIMSSSETREWGKAQWVGWLWEGLEIYTNNNSQSAFAFAPFDMSYSIADRGAGLYEDIPKLVQSIEKAALSEKKQSPFGGCIGICRCR